MYTEPDPNPCVKEQGAEGTNGSLINHTSVLANCGGTCIMEIYTGNTYETELAERGYERYMYKHLDVNNTDHFDDDTDIRLQSETMTQELGTEHHHDLTEVDEQFESIEGSSYINMTINGKWKAAQNIPYIYYKTMPPLVFQNTTYIRDSYLY